MRDEGQQEIPNHEGITKQGNFQILLNYSSTRFQDPVFNLCALNKARTNSRPGPEDLQQATPWMASDSSCLLGEYSI